MNTGKMNSDNSSITSSLPPSSPSVSGFDMSSSPVGNGKPSAVPPLHIVNPPSQNSYTPAVSSQARPSARPGVHGANLHSSSESLPLKRPVSDSVLAGHGAVGYASSACASQSFADENRGKENDPHSNGGGTRQESGQMDCSREHEQVPFHIKYAANSWHDTLTRFPSLLRLYPLASSSECALDGEEQPVEADERDSVDKDAHAQHRPPHDIQSAIAEPAGGEPANHSEQRVRPGTQAAPPANVDTSPATNSPVDRAPHSASFTGTTMSHANTQSQEHAFGPRGMADLPRTMSAYQPAQPPVESDWYNQCEFHYPSTCSNDDIAGAWAEIDQVREELDQRERELAQREAAVRRSEVRNSAVSQQLDELRHRLDEYSEELEEGVIALTAQQNALREERRQTIEMQARARRMCAAAVRDEVVSSRSRNWDHRSWTPTSTMRS